MTRTVTPGEHGTSRPLTEEAIPSLGNGLTQWCKNTFLPVHLPTVSSSTWLTTVRKVSNVRFQYR